jgi:hypothetical protein
VWLDLRVLNMLSFKGYAARACSQKKPAQHRVGAQCGSRTVHRTLLVLKACATVPRRRFVKGKGRAQPDWISQKTPDFRLDEWVGLTWSTQSRSELAISDEAR